ncbi:hypothetical protein C3L33_02258, partial [Rhododendron williamsianum]
NLLAVAQQDLQTRLFSSPDTTVCFSLDGDPKTPKEQGKTTQIPNPPTHIAHRGNRHIVLLSSLRPIYYGTGFSLFSSAKEMVVPKNRPRPYRASEKFLYWGDRIDCPGKHCDSCEGLGHQESSLRCALEEAMFLNRTFVMPSRMCINPIHNTKGILHQSENATSEERWAASSCGMDSLYDLDLMSNTIPVILDNSETWHEALSFSMKLGSRGIAHVAGASRFDLKEKSRYSNMLVINRTAVLFHGKLLLPYPQIKELLGDYVAIHVRRGDKLKTRKDRHGVDRSLHPHLDRDTRPEFILCRISTWVPPGHSFSLLQMRGSQVSSHLLLQVNQFLSIFSLSSQFSCSIYSRNLMSQPKMWIRNVRFED